MNKRQGFEKLAQVNGLVRDWPDSIDAEIPDLPAPFVWSLNLPKGGGDARAVIVFSRLHEPAAWFVTREEMAAYRAGRQVTPAPIRKPITRERAKQVLELHDRHEIVKAEICNVEEADGLRFHCKGGSRFFDQTTERDRRITRIARDAVLEALRDELAYIEKELQGDA